MPKELIAVSVLGMGPAPGEINACMGDPKAWIVNQIENPGKLIRELRNQPNFSELSKLSRTVRENRSKEKYRSNKQRDPMFGYIRTRMDTDINLRHEQAIRTSTSFVERWYRFWCNRFTVSARDNFLKLYGGCFERDAIRPNIFGNFSDLLRATTLHPAMLYYLDNSQSIGPNSRRGRKHGGNFNENLAREVLELHTLGVDGGYTITDVQSLAKALTGWRHPRPRNVNAATFNINSHEPGPTIVLGKHYPDLGQEQIVPVLNDLALHESTARNIAKQLVRHFVPAGSESLIDELARAFLESEGDLKALALKLVGLDMVWSQNKTVFKNPEEFLISIGRALPEWRTNFIKDMPRLLGQPIIQAPSPAGWEQTGESWINAQNILIRIGGLRRTIKTLPNWIDLDVFLSDCFGTHLSNRTRRAIHSANTREEKFLIALMSPDFLKR